MYRLPSNDHIRRRKPDPHAAASGGEALQYGAICLRVVADGGALLPEVLLITSRDTGRWVIPKGWGKAKKMSFEVAKEEAWEEAGVRGRVWKKALGSYRYGKVLEDGAVVQARVKVHLILVSRIEERFPEKGQRTCRWFAPAEAADAVREPELKRLFALVPSEVAKLVRRSKRVKSFFRSLAPDTLPE